MLGWNLTATSLAITMPAVVYTMFGGVQAVTWTDVKIMVLIVFGLFAMIVAAVARPARRRRPRPTAWASRRPPAGCARFDFSFDLTNQYTFWSGTIAALFLFCSYFGTDQSQVQRYLTARSVDEARHSLLMSAYWKIPLQVVVLLLGVLVFVFYVFNAAAAAVQQRRRRSGCAQGAAAPAYAALRVGVRRRRSRRGARPATALAAARDSRRRRAIAGGAGRRFATAKRRCRRCATGRRRWCARRRGDRTFTDVNYIIPTFILTQLPIGLIGLLIVAILMAATDTIAGELNSLSTATVIDFYKRRVRPAAPDAHYLTVSKIATGLWGLFACAVAVWAAELGSLIEVVNRFGSFFYGSILGVFILAVGFPRATGNGAFVGLIAGMASVAWAASLHRRRLSLAQRHRRGRGRHRRVSPSASGSWAARASGLNDDLRQVRHRHHRGDCRVLDDRRSAAGSHPAMIRIFVTGGTFDKTYDEIRGGLSFGDTHLPEMLRLGRSRVEVSIRTLMMIDSLEMTDARPRAHRPQLRSSARRARIVVTHGTDTMVETAAALAGGVAGKTIVLTGAMIPYAFGSSDGLFNLGSALSFAQLLPARRLHRHERAALRVGHGEEEPSDRRVRADLTVTRRQKLRWLPPSVGKERGSRRQPEAT